MDDPFNLRRFVEAQDLVYRSVIGELRAGVKQSHWMWFVFPQVAGLGRSATAEMYAIGSLDEAKAYLAHPLLGGRLRECTQLMLDVTGKSARQILGSPDDLKFFSSMTLLPTQQPTKHSSAMRSRNISTKKRICKLCGCYQFNSSPSLSGRAISQKTAALAAPAIAAAGSPSLQIKPR